MDRESRNALGGFTGMRGKRGEGWTARAQRAMFDHMSKRGQGWVARVDRAVMRGKRGEGEAAQVRQLLNISVHCGSASLVSSGGRTEKTHPNIHWIQIHKKNSP